MKEDYVVWQGHPSWRGLIIRYWKMIASLLLFDLFFFLLHAVGLVSLGFLLLFILASGALFVGYGYLRIKTTIYTVTQNRVSEKYGIINVQKEQAHLANITNIIVNKNIAERLLGIARLDIDTANDTANILDWWGVKGADSIENMIDDLRFDIEGSSKK